MLLPAAIGKPIHRIASRLAVPWQLVAVILSYPTLAIAQQAPADRVKQIADEIEKFGTGSRPLSAEERLRLLRGFVKKAQSNYLEARNTYQQAWLDSVPAGDAIPSVCPIKQVTYTSFECAKRVEKESTQKSTTTATAGGTSTSEAPCIEAPQPVQKACNELLRTEPHMARVTFQFLRQLSYKNALFEDHVEYTREALILSRVGRSELWDELGRLPEVPSGELPQLSKVVEVALKNDKSLWPLFETFLRKLSAKGVSKEDFGSMLRFFDRFHDPSTRELIKGQLRELERTAGATREQVKRLDSAVDALDPAAFMAGLLDLNALARRQALSWVNRASARQRYLQQESPASGILVAFHKPAVTDPVTAKVLTDFVNHLVRLLAATTTEGVPKPRPVEDRDWKHATTEPMSLCKTCDAVLLVDSSLEQEQFSVTGSLNFRQIPGTVPTKADESGGKLRVKIPISPSSQSSQSSECLSLERASDAAAAAGRFMHQLRGQLGVVFGDLAFVRELQSTVAVMEPLHCGVTVDAQLFGLMSELRRYLNGQHKVSLRNDEHKPCSKRWLEGVRLGLQTRDLYSEGADQGVELRLTATDPNGCVGTLSLDQPGTGKGPVYRAAAKTSKKSLHSQGGMGMAHYVAALYPQRFAVPDATQEATASLGNAFWAIVSPGLPWLADDVEKWNNVGIAASGLDLALWAGAAAAYSRSIELRDVYAETQRPEDQSRSGDYRRLANWTVLSAATLRLVAATVYVVHPPVDGAQPTAGLDLTRGWAWTF